MTHKGIHPTSVFCECRARGTVGSGRITAPNALSWREAEHRAIPCEAIYKILLKDIKQGEWVEGLLTQYYKDAVSVLINLKVQSWSKSLDESEGCHE